MPGYDLALLDVALMDGRRADIGFFEGKVAHIGAVERSDEIIRCHGMLLIPAATDMHVHMRGGSQSAKEDWHSGSMSAIAGGVTVVVDQPNTVPPITTPERLVNRVKDAESMACCGFGINAGIEQGIELSHVWSAGAMAFGELFAGPSSYGEALPAGELSRALREVRRIDGLATIHAEDVGTSKVETLAAHDSNRGPAGEAGSVRKVCQLNTPGCRLHFCHLSTTGSISAVLEERARMDTGIQAAAGNSFRHGITFEVTPHHLLLTNQDFDPGDTLAKVNPPLRGPSVQKALWTQWDMIDVIASDHAPHTLVEKNTGFPQAPSGIPGVETMVPLLLAEVYRRKLPVNNLVEKISTNPCRILGIPQAGIFPGERADFALFPREISRVDPSGLHSRAGWTPFEGMPAVFPELVIREGKVVYHNREFFSSVARWYPGRGFSGTR